MNGAAARLTQVNDRIIVISYANMTPEEAKSHKPTVVIVDENNDPKKIIDETKYASEYDLESGMLDNTLQ
jgi:aspartate 1-decarboxylase